ncbi:MAG: hypothetical protein JWQ35_409 [Bacteriovoracaceae bacterium]|nr:hypothetical protein [Bacteriovoracaceae bacterium]
MKFRSKGIRGFTFLEILAVISLVAIVFGVAALTFTASKQRMSNVSYQFTQDIQSLYADAIKTGRIHRLQLNEQKDAYSLDIFEMPVPRPRQDDREATEKWEKRQKEIEDSWKDKDRANLTRLDRGTFQPLKKRVLNSSLKIKTFVTAESLKEDQKQVPPILFYPSGETDQTLIVIEDVSGGKILSLEVDPLSGRVKTIPNEVSLDQWKKDVGIK